MLLLVDAIVRAAMKEHFSSCPQDLNAPLNSARETALHVAGAGQGRASSQPGGKLSVFDARNRTPLHYATYDKVNPN
jgi:hypothetical protein